MTSSDLDEARAELLARLPIFAADPERADRTRQRCRDLLGRRQRRREHVRSRAEIVRRGARAAIASVFCVLYVAYVTALVATTFRLESVLP